MPLLDHFHPPLSERRSWEGFHGLWAAALVEKLNGDVLVDEFYADMQVYVGGRVEVDVATLDPADAEPDRQAEGAGVATLARVWAPPATDLIIATEFPDEIEVQVFATTTGATLVAAIELVSPGNKDHPRERRAFVAKCVDYLSRGIGLIVVDVVTNRLSNLHNEMMSVLGQAGRFLLSESAATYAVAYRPSRRASGDQIEVWPNALDLGEALPVLPLALRNATTVAVDLEETYGEACRRSRI